MKMKALLLLGAMAMALPAAAQVKIGNNPQAIDPASLLELESSDQVLVITRISTAQMEAITPSPGALVYNTDAGCLYYYNGAQWVNICESLPVTFTAEAIVNPAPSIVITQAGDTLNFEVALNAIRSENIVDFTIGSQDIQNNAINDQKLAPNSVGTEELQDNAVTDNELDYNAVTLADFTNDAGYITSANIVSTDAGNSISQGTDFGAYFNAESLETMIFDNADAISDLQNDKEDVANKSDDTALGNSATLYPTQNAVKTYVDDAILASTQTIVSGQANNSITAGVDGGAFLDLTPLQTQVTSIETDLNAHVTADGDLDDQNELQDLQLNTDILTLTNPATPGNQVSLAPYLDNTDEQTLALTANELSITGGNNVDLGILTLPANQIAYTPYLTIGSTDTQAALNELKDELDAVQAGSGTTEEADQITITGDGSPGNAFQVAVGGITDLQLADNAVTTPKILDANVTPAKIAPSATDGQILTTTLGTVVWADPVAASVGTDTSIDGDGTIGNELSLADNAVTTAKILDGQVQTDDIADDNVTVDKIAQGAAGQVLTTDGAGDVVWATASAGAVGTDASIDGDGTIGNELSLADNAVTTAKILDGEVQTDDIADNGVTSAKILDGQVQTDDLADANVTVEKIAPGVAGQVLTTNGVGDVIWETATAGAVGTDTSIDGDGTLGNELSLADNAVTTAKILDGQVQTGDIADNNVTVDKIAQGAAGQVLTTDGAGDVVWATPAPAFVGTDASIDGDGTIGNELSLADDAVTSAKILDGEVQTDDLADDNVTVEKIAEGTAGQVLTTDGAGDVVWAAPVAAAVATDASIDGDGTTGNELSLADDAVTSAKILDGQVQTDDLADDNVTVEKIAQGAAGQVLTTDGAGDVVWAAPVAAAVATDASIDGDGTTGNELSLADDAITSAKILDGQVQTDDLADDNITVEKIAEGTAGQVLTTDGAGDVVWAAPVAAAVATDASIDGDGTIGNELSLADDAVTSAKILDGQVQADDLADDNVTVEKIAEGTAGQVLTTDGAGDVVWAAPVASPVTSDGTTITGDGVNTDLSVPDGGITTTQIADGTIDNIDIAFNAIGTNNIQDGAVNQNKIAAAGSVGQVLTTNAAFQVVWATPSAGIVNVDETTIAGDGVGTPLNIPANAITSGLIQDGQIQTDDIANDNVTVDKIAQGSAGQVLTTDGVGDVIWATPANANQTVSAGTGIGVIQVGQDFQISNTNPDQPITLTDGGSGNVTIGGTYPNFTIDVASTTDADADPTNENQTVSAGTGINVIQTGQDFEVTNTAPDQTVTLADGGSGNITIGGAYPNFTIDVSTLGLSGSAGSIFFANNTDGSPTENNAQLFWDQANNRLGIGTNSPVRALEVVGETRSTSFATPGGSEALPGYGFSTNDDFDTGMFRAGNNVIGFSTAGSEAIRINANQFVGIGNNNPVERLEVDGNIQVNAAGLDPGNVSIDGAFISNGTTLVVPDYVFQKYFEKYSTLENEYKFKPLDEIADFIKKNHHLPGIESAEQVRKNGVWNLTQASLNNLEKIEELFLHTLEQQEQIDALKKENAGLSKELEDMKLRMARIEEALNQKSGE